MAADMDFALLPPEINSGRMYSGPGAAPMLAAATAWDSLAADLESAAVGCAGVISGLLGHSWSGPASAAMVTATTPYVAWLQSAAAKAEQTGLQAKAAAAAFEAAFAATVPPAAVEANRTLLVTLVATNFLGQNTPAIAATEALYAEMWAQDAAAMYGYAAAAAPASALPHLDQPPQAGTGHPLPAMPVEPSTPASTTASTTASAPTSALATLGSLVNPVTPFTSVAASGISFDSSMYTVVANGAGWGRLVFVRSGVEGALTFEGLGPRGVLSAATRPTVGSSALGAGLGRATPIGGLSVPPSWVSAAPEVRSVAVTLTAAESELPAAVGLPPGSVFQEAMMGTTAGQGSMADSTDRRGRKTGQKSEDSDGQPTVTLTNGNGWLASAWAHHTRRRESTPLPSHWRTGPSNQSA